MKGCATQLQIVALFQIIFVQWKIITAKITKYHMASLPGGWRVNVHIKKLMKLPVAASSLKRKNCKVEKILKGSLDSIPSPSPSVTTSNHGWESLLEV